MLNSEPNLWRALPTGSNAVTFGEPTSLILVTGYRDVDGGPDRDAVGVFVCGSDYATYGTGISGGRGGRNERSGERSSRGRKWTQTISDSRFQPGFTLVDSQSGFATSYAKSRICKLTSAGTG